MKKCDYCGCENSDEATHCAECGTAFSNPPQLSSPKNDKLASESQLWKKMTLKQIFVALIRLQALWLFFYAAVYVTYLPSYFQRLHYAPAYSTSYADAKFALLMELLRILMHIVAAMLIIQYTEPVMNYLLKDAKDEHEAAGE